MTTHHTVAAASLDVLGKIVQDVEVISGSQPGREVNGHAEYVDVAGNRKLRPEKTGSQRLSGAKPAEKVKDQNGRSRVRRQVVEVLEGVDHLVDGQVLTDHVCPQNGVQG